MPRIGSYMPLHWPGHFTIELPRLFNLIASIFFAFRCLLLCSKSMARLFVNEWLQMMTSSWIDCVVTVMICAFMASSAGAVKCYQCHSNSYDDWCTDPFKPPNPLPEGASCGNEYDACVKIEGENDYQ